MIIPITARLALIFFVCLFLDTLSVKSSFQKSSYFILFANLLPECTLQRWHFSFNVFYLPHLYIDRQIKVILYRHSTHANSIFSADNLFLFILKCTLSFLFRIPEFIPSIHIFQNVYRGSFVSRMSIY